MTIMEALERAKLLRAAKEQNTNEQRLERPAVSMVDAADSIVRQVTGNDEPEPSIFADLARVEFSSTTCELNHILVQDDPRGDIARADASYRMLRSRVLNRVRSSNWSCLGVTSPGPGEGKTVTTVNLALCIAREKQRPVYLIDLDMRSPSALEYLGVQPPVALSRYFAEDVPPDGVLFATEMPGFIVGGNREPVPNASELLSTDRLQQLLAHIRRRSADALIVIDLPPVMSTDEALVVAPRVDGMLLVVSEGITRRSELQRAIDLLSDFPIAGIVMNRSTEGIGRKYYGAY